jgi:hypothetical protein
VWYTPDQTEEEGRHERIGAEHLHRGVEEVREEFEHSQAAEVMGCPPFDEHASEEILAQAVHVELSDALVLLLRRGLDRAGDERRAASGQPRHLPEDPTREPSDLRRAERAAEEEEAEERKTERKA